jgi:tRNA-binding EMAP/Myf-like protein
MQETATEYIARILSNVGDRDPWEVLTSTAACLRQLVAGRPAEALAFKPDPSRWSTIQILAHLADAEIVAAWRLRSILAADNHPLQAFDQDRWAGAFKYADTDPAESLQVFDVTRRSLLALLGRVDPARREHAGLHEERGRETVTHLIRLYAGHDLNHLRQIEDLLKAAADARPFVPAPVKPVSDGALDAADVRLGTIEAVDEVAESRKLVKLSVSFGDHRRTIVAGLKQERPDPSVLVGRQALFALNLLPRRMAGIDSEGMLFDVGFADGLRPCLLIPEHPMPDGTRAG